MRDLLTLTARDLPTVHVDVDVRDVDDVPVVAAAVAGRANVIVTGVRDLPDDAGSAAGWRSGASKLSLRSNWWRGSR